MIAEEKPARPLIRIDDTSFLFETDERPVIIVLPGVKNDGRLARQVAEAACGILKTDSNVEEKAFELRNRQWKLIHKNSENAGYLDFLWNFVNYFQTVYENTLAKTYTVKETTSVFKLWPDDYENEFPDRSIPCEECFDSSGKEPYSSPPFSDPFTRLAAIAFQEHETAFFHRDYFSFDQLQTRIVFRDGQFSLVKASDPLAKDEKCAGTTLELFQKHIVETYGAKKIDEIISRYNIDFDDSVGLTPEHVYRINVGVHEIFIDDVQDLWDSIRAVKKLSSWENSQSPLEDFFLCIPPDLWAGRVKRALFHLFKRSWNKPKKGDLCTWFNHLRDFIAIKDVHDLPPKLFTDLMGLLIPEKEACDRSLTGRKSYGGVHGYYTNAQTKEYKPWVDQQDLFQTIILLREQRVPELFYEKLAFVISKKHLARSIEGDNYRVGGLIPAPCDFSWYEVTSCVSLPTGIMSYTLESAHKTRPLDNIKLFRSTASDSCALRSKESLLCDINWANSPGYMGRRLGKDYEFPFFKERSIPVWYGYVLWAKSRLELKSAGRYIDEIVQILSKANQEFLKYSTHEVEKKSLKQIIREHDEILSYLYRKRRSQFGSFPDIRSKFRKSMADMLMTEVNKGKDREIAQKLFDDLQAFSEAESDPGILHRIVRLKDDVYCHALSCLPMSYFNKERSVQDENCDIFHMDKKVKAAKSQEDKLEILSKWAGRFDDIARGRNVQESLEFKKRGNLVLTGHSLGGACAMSYLDLYFRICSGGRIPLPGCYCAGYVFDDPGTNDEDNERFKEWGYRHRDLMKQLKSQFFIRRIHEKGDVVVTGGEVHLGATYSKKEDELLKTWLETETLLRERLPRPKCVDIALSPCAHGTMFEEGMPGVDYTEEKVDSYHLGELGSRGKIKSVYNRCSDEFNREFYADEERRLIWASTRLRWKLGGAIVRFDSEYIRTHTWVETAVEWIWGGQSDDRIDHLTDHHGVFVVTRKGVKSKIKRLEVGEAGDAQAVSWLEMAVNWIWGSQSDERIDDLRDEQGVFVVTQAGVESKLEGGDEGKADCV